MEYYYYIVLLVAVYIFSWIISRDHYQSKKYGYQVPLSMEMTKENCRSSLQAYILERDASGYNPDNVREITKAERTDGFMILLENS